LPFFGESRCRLTSGLSFFIALHERGSTFCQQHAEIKSRRLSDVRNTDGFHRNECYGIFFV
ncbi:MAG: hypothetical protein ACTTGW_00005, partial [Candidatus Cryptobacteroides sp.]